MKTKTRLEPPDGGWGILVCIGMAMPFISGLAALPSFGLVFGDFLKSIGAETSAIGFITSAFFCAFSFAGLFSGSLFNRFGLRTVGLLGGTLYFVGSLLQIFVTSTITLLLAFSLIQGTGFGLMVPTSYTTFNNYFVKKRIMWMSFAQSLIGVGSMFYPVLMQKLLEAYGFRGCLMVLAAINSHAVLGMLLMQPVEWHMRKVQVEDEEIQEIDNTLELARVTPKEQVEQISNTNDCREEDSNHLSPLMYNRKSSQKLSREMLEKISSRCSSITSLGNWTGPIVVSDASPEMSNVLGSRRPSTIVSAVNSLPCDKEEKRSICQIIVDFLDLTLLKKPIYVNIVLGISFALYSDIAFFTLQPLYMFELGFNKPDTASVIAIGAAADLGSRIFLAFLAVFVQMPSRYIYLAGSFFTVISRFVFLNAFDFKSMSIITAVMGFLRTWIHVPLPLIFAEYLPKERFASGYGLFMFLQGNIMFAIGPVVGYLRDKTQDYILTFHCLNFFMGLCAFPWILEIIYVKFRRRTKINATVVESSAI
ncbi:monocarboxylate transporter 7 [Lucilia sericata]|uniref:monocarboxylate transporter 7 n=1 Tax=Lucilia sericata TaxID=13632 RepID=UPI0018A85B13|nr:monocarboxylate transporter 7 [Lucilia sericata]